jgi:hypothetical protein
MGLNLEAIKEKSEKIANRKLEVFRDYFKGRTDVFAEQRQDGSYFTVERELLVSDITEHLEGQRTLGIYPIFSQNSLVNFLVIDIDIKDFTLVQRVVKACLKLGIPKDAVLLEDSGCKGHHIWIFFAQPISAEKAQRFGKIIISDIKNDDIEIFPKQKQVLPGDYGNLIKLPLGIHKKTGNKTCFLDEYANPINDWEDHLQNILFVTEGFVEVILRDNNIVEDKSESGSANNSEPSQQNRVLPCFEMILTKGVDEGKRDNVGFRLAIYLKYNGLPLQGSLDVMMGWNKRNRPPLPAEDIEKITRSVYDKDYGGFGCGESYMNEFCEGNCPIKRKQESSLIVSHEFVEDDVTDTDTDLEPEDDIKPMPRDLIPDGFLRDYIDFVAPLSEAPLQFHMASGLTLVAVACGRRIFHKQGAVKIFPNLYVLVFGRSGVARKTTALTPAFKIVNALDPELYLGSITSLEAFYDALRVHPNKFGYYSEFKTFLENCGKKYGEGLIPAMTDAYDCPDRLKINLKSIKHNERFILEPAFSILAATNSSWFQVKEADIIGGFFGRFLIIMAGERERLLPRPPAMEDTRLEEMVSRLRYISGLSGEFVFTEEACKEYDRIYIEIAERQEQLANKRILEPFWSRVHTSIIKLAMIRKISQRELDCHIDVESVKWAYDVMNYVIRYYQYVVSRVTTNEFKKTEQRALDILKEAKDKGIVRSALLKKLDIDSKRFSILINTLAEKGQLKEEVVRGRTKSCKVYYLSRYHQ